MIINRDPTPYDHLAVEVIREPIGSAVAKVCDTVRVKAASGQDDRGVNGTAAPTLRAGPVDGPIATIDQQPPSGTTRAGRLWQRRSLIGRGNAESNDGDQFMRTERHDP